MTRALLALLLTIAHLPLSAATRARPVQQPPEPIAKAARVAAENALKTGVPAVQIAVAQRGRVVYSGAFGVSDVESGTPATARSVLQVGSIMKPFTAAGILRLAERGLLSLDDPIEKYVTEFKPKASPITLRHLLTHTSGLQGPAPDQQKPTTREQTIKLLEGYPLAFTPGSQFSYSNSGFKLLGYAIESITGQPFADFVESEFAVPLGLVDTGICGTDDLPVPEGYGVVQGKWSRMPPVHPTVAFSAGALCSTTTDLVRWAHLLGTGKVLQPSSYAAMLTPPKLANNTLSAYGLGIFLQKQQARSAVWHTGGIDGFLSSVIYFPEEELAVSVIINALPAPSGVSPHFMANEIAAAVFAAKPMQ